MNHVQANTTPARSKCTYKVSPIWHVQSSPTDPQIPTSSRLSYCQSPPLIYIHLPSPNKPFSQSPLPPILPAGAIHTPFRLSRQLAHGPPAQSRFQKPYGMGIHTFSLILLRQYLHLTCFLITESSAAHPYALAMTNSASAMTNNRMILLMNSLCNPNNGRQSHLPPLLSKTVQKSTTISHLNPHIPANNIPVSPHHRANQEIQEIEDVGKRKHTHKP